MSKATALVQHGPGSFDLQEFALPTPAEGEMIVRVEANGLCASDIDAYHTTDFDWDGRPRILGHEVAGVIERMGPRTVNRQGLEVGDRVCINPFVPCGICSRCLLGDIGGCNGRTQRIRLGMVPIDVSPSLWGGYSTHVFLPRNGIVYKVPPQVSALDATLWQPIAGGFEWAVAAGGMRVGDRVLIIGPGQRGLGAVLAVRSAGSSQVVVAGRSSSQFKLDAALAMGADAVINTDEEDFVERGKELTGGEGFDVILDTTPRAVAPVNDSVELLRRGGTIVVIGVKLRTLDGFPIDKLLLKNGTLKACAGSSDRSYRIALDLVSAIPEKVAILRTHVFGFDQLKTAINTLEDRTAGQKAINVVVVPPTTTL
ncbi:zinc-dependent alcohol dehydrogenase [Pseudarthrobacter siccitolerans]